MTTAMKAYVRTTPIRSLQYLTAQVRHARRLDASSARRMRAGGEPGQGCDWPARLRPRPEDPGRNYVAERRALLAREGAAERKGAALGLHLLVGVGRAWTAEAGCIHDAANPRNQALLQAAVDWANGWSGQGVFAARLDLDEWGAAVVDVFIAPIRTERHKSGSTRCAVSANKALEEVALEWTGKRSRHYGALNTSWADYAQKHLDPRLQRGTPKRGADPDHVLPDVLRERLAICDATDRKLAAREGALMERSRALAARHATLAEREAACQARETKLQALLGQAKELEARVRETAASAAQAAAATIAGIITGETRIDEASRQWLFRDRTPDPIILNAIQPALISVGRWWIKAFRRVEALPDPEALIRQLGTPLPEAPTAEAPEDERFDGQGM